MGYLSSSQLYSTHFQLPLNPNKLLSLSQPTYVIVSLCLFTFEASPFPTLRLLLCPQYQLLALLFFFFLSWKPLDLARYTQKSNPKSRGNKGKILCKSHGTYTTGCSRKKTMIIDKHVVFLSRFEIGDEYKEKEGNSLGGKNEKRMSNWDEGGEIILRVPFVERKVKRKINIKIKKLIKGKI